MPAGENNGILGGPEEEGSAEALPSFFCVTVAAATPLRAFNVLCDSLST
jgi:hypothetical protein